MVKSSFIDTQVCLQDFYAIKYILFLKYGVEIVKVGKNKSTVDYAV